MPIHILKILIILGILVQTISCSESEKQPQQGGGGGGRGGQAVVVEAVVAELAELKNSVRGVGILLPSKEVDIQA
jgi:multidrug efflux pump subunit AcrA (membrane-fusion protein)